jgi:hypothetical protein
MIVGVVQQQNMIQSTSGGIGNLLYSGTLTIGSGNAIGEFGYGLMFNGSVGARGTIDPSDLNLFHFAIYEDTFNGIDYYKVFLSQYMGINYPIENSVMDDITYTDLNSFWSYIVSKHNSSETVEIKLYDQSQL